MLKHVHRRAQKNRRGYYLVLSIILLIFLVVFFFFVRPALALIGDVNKLKEQGGHVKLAVQSQDLTQIAKSLKTTSELVDKTKNDFERLFYIKFVPGLGQFYTDGTHLFAAVEHAFSGADTVLTSLEPFKDVLGFAGRETGEGQPQTAEEKIAQFVQISPSIVPALQQAAVEIDKVRQELDTIDPSRYPESVFGFEVRGLLQQAKNQLNGAELLLAQAGPFLTALPQALGEPEPQTYLVLFQNDKEIRPTGGFITAFALLTFEGGKFTIDRSDNIYAIDPENGALPAPQPILQYLKVPSLHMRDANFSPDFKLSMQDFEIYAASTSLPSINGIIALDTQFLEALMEITGPVEISQYSLDFGEYPNLPEACKLGGTEFTTENVVCRLELYTQQILLGSDTRKQILADLMNQLVDKMLRAESDVWLSYVETIFKQAEEKHILFYFHDDAIQNLMEAYNWAGRIKEVDESTDYLHISDANLAGLKADMYLRREVLQDINIGEGGEVTKTVTLIYENPEPQDGWLNAVARNYVRVYVPLGSDLIEFTGDVTRPAETFDELGKTVFDNFILIPPLETSSVTIKYKLPFTVESSEYQLMIQKQPGKAEIPHEVSINGERSQLFLRHDQELSFRLGISK